MNDSENRILSKDNRKRGETYSQVRSDVRTMKPDCSCMKQSDKQREQTDNRERSKLLRIER